MVQPDRAIPVARGKIRDKALGAKSHGPEGAFFYWIKVFLNKGLIRPP